MGDFSPLTTLMEHLAAGAAKADSALFRAEQAALDATARYLREHPDLFHVPAVGQAIIAAVAPPRVRLTRMEISVATLIEAQRETERAIGLRIGVRPVTSLLFCRSAIDERQTAHFQMEIVRYPGLQAPQSSGEMKDADAAD